MAENEWLEKEAQRTLARLMPRIEPVLKRTSDIALFWKRLDREFPRLFRLLHQLYSDQYDFFYHLEEILKTAARAFAERSRPLKALDRDRESHPHWFQSEKMIGAVCYVDLFAGNLEGVRAKIPYFRELGLTYLHLMPLFLAPEANSDGGYAVSDYRTVNPALGTMEDLARLADELRANGISLVLDFVFNHTSDEHTWAKRAIAGDEEYLDYYFTFPDRTLPDQYQRHLREIFPEQAPSSFLWREDLQRWVWTTFYYFQWDLNYRNPDVFNAMLGEMLFLANQGVEVLRLDAVAFIWKQMGTSCESLPQAHWIIQAYNALVRIAAPALVFKSEAIVHPSDVAAYVSLEEAQISYNPTLMALLWDALATRKTTLLRHSMSRRFWLPDGCAWVNYVRVHDDIGWTFADEDAAEVGVWGYDHRQFLNRFYTGRFEGSFARGLPFNFNPMNNDMRISGTAASLAGLELALDAGNPEWIEHALRRLLLIHSVILSAGGIPLLYLGDEIATLNDYSYRQDPGKQGDSRWVHRPRFDWARAEERKDAKSIPGRIFHTLEQLITIRKEGPVFGEAPSTFIDCANEHVLAYVRGGRLLVLANFSELAQSVEVSSLSAYAPIEHDARDMVSERAFAFGDQIHLEPYDFLWLHLCVEDEISNNQ